MIKKKKDIETYQPTLAITVKFTVHGAQHLYNGVHGFSSIFDSITYFTNCLNVKSFIDRFPSSKVCFLILLINSELYLSFSDDFKL